MRSLMIFKDLQPLIQTSLQALTYAISRLADMFQIYLVILLNRISRCQRPSFKSRAAVTDA